MIDRRQFLQMGTGCLAAASGWAAAAAAPAPASARLIPRLGLQLFTIPVLLERDIALGLQQVAQVGYRELELYGPYPFSSQSAHERWRAVTPSLGFTQSGYFGLTAQQFRALLDRNGLTAPSMHVDLETLQTRLPQVLEAAQRLGHRYAGLSSIPAELRRTNDDYRRMADVFNELGARMAGSGLHFLYHNHGYGLAPVAGQVPLQLLIERIDPKYVSLEMDVFWTTAGGADPVELLDAWPGRYRLIHLKDMKQRVRFAGDGGEPAQWVKLFPYMTNAGEGVLDMRNIVTHARQSGVEHFIVEYDQAPDPLATLRTNYRNLMAL
jgi:sugar phosphate isomerase/epimerase